MTEIISRSEVKRRLKRIEDTAGEMAELTNSDLRTFPGNDEMKREIMTIRDLKGGARKRQIKHLAKLMRQQEEGLDAIYDYLQQRKGSQQKADQLLHEAERQRDAIVNEAIADFEECRRLQQQWEPDWKSAVIADVLGRYPAFDEQAARKAAFQYARSRNRAHYKELYRIVRAAMDQEEIRRRLA